MKSIICALILCLSLFGQAQANNGTASMYVNGYAQTVYYAPTNCYSLPVQIQLFGPQNAYFEIWGNPGGFGTPTAYCTFFADLQMSYPPVLLFSGFLGPVCGCYINTNASQCTQGDTFNWTIQAIVYAGACGYAFSAATHVVTP